MENHHFSWENHGKSPFFMGKSQFFMGNSTINRPFSIPKNAILCSLRALRPAQRGRGRHHPHARLSHAWPLQLSKAKQCRLDPVEDEIPASFNRQKPSNDYIHIYIYIVYYILYCFYILYFIYYIFYILYYILYILYFILYIIFYIVYFVYILNIIY